MAAKIEPSGSRTALVVEDNNHTAKLVEFVLERAGYKVFVAKDGREADSFLNDNAPVDAVILDLMLPYLSGEELITRIREHPQWRKVPVVVLTGKVLETDVINALELGADDFLTKPFRPQELVARLRRLQERQRWFV